MVWVFCVYFGWYYVQELQVGVFFVDVYDCGQYYFDVLNVVCFQFDRGQYVIGCVECGYQGNVKVGCCVDQVYVEFLVGQCFEVGFQVLFGFVQWQKNGIGQFGICFDQGQVCVVVIGCGCILLVIGWYRVKEVVCLSFDFVLCQGEGGIGLCVQVDYGNVKVMFQEVECQVNNI